MSSNMKRPEDILLELSKLNEMIRTQFNEDDIGLCIDTLLWVIGTNVNPPSYNLEDIEE